MCKENFGMTYRSDIPANPYQCFANVIAHCAVPLRQGNENELETFIQCEVCEENYIQVNSNSECEPLIIPNCDYVDEGKCKECHESYVISEDQLRCVSKQFVSNCDVAMNSKDECHTCTDRYAQVIKNGKSLCVGGAIDFCKELQRNGNT